MDHSPLFNEGELHLLVAYALESDQEMSEAIVKAFLAAHVEVFDEATTLADWINTDVFDDLRWSSDGPTYLCTRIWDHTVVITAEEIRIYHPEPLV